ncbi:Sec-independent protein translocase protein TatA [Thermobacillus xylanilyticus]|jgi:sec-independent protein translocase protein TatA|uniref:Sec-independent protein translocase protein TatA n=1 Tax=Thermobacillus xylanilyticus TaxID=76633 RepID=A0ABM8UZM0_THEXY|nr:twin-arginine translocase TatA/TatE family subunit [Thermobacillus xylanilyticus]REJ12247.1 MAG: twin-arginine translocase TatA/TatE family subunit [Paenibacillaceae bacterium]CAG5076676.1 Sec-independent protein translocase protein TatA [Thermobacillus xylanilyticus]
MVSGIGVTGFILLIIVALLLFGPSKLPELGRAFGRTLREFKQGAREIVDDIERDESKGRLEAGRPENQDSADKKRLPE